MPRPTIADRRHRAAVWLAYTTTRGSGRRDWPPGVCRRIDELVRAVESLSPAARACLLLRTLEGMDYRGISGLLGIPQATAMSHVHRARKLLRQRLEVASRAAGGNNGQSRIDRERKTRTE
jgi:DNA-directed RNA polymerase specialized sigma24 family protein